MFECQNILFFCILHKDILKKLRTIDDRIIHGLNTTIPTDSFSDKVDATSACKMIYNKVK